MPDRNLYIVIPDDAQHSATRRRGPSRDTSRGSRSFDDNRRSVRAVDVETESRWAAVDEFARAFEQLAPLGPWIDDAACGGLDRHGADVFTVDGVLGGYELDAALRVCRHCPVRREDDGYVTSTTVYRLWGGVWHGRGRGERSWIMKAA